MNYNHLPSIPIAKLDRHVFQKVYGIYCEVAGIQPADKARYDSEFIAMVTSDLLNMTLRQFTLGSRLHRDSKLTLYPRHDQNRISVVFDFDPNTADDTSKKPRAMREKFLKKVQDYIDHI